MLEVTPVRPAVHIRAFAVLMMAITATAAEAATAQVVNSNDDGPGSFRRAIAMANSSPSVHRIVIDALGRRHRAAEHGGLYGQAGPHD